MAKRKSESTMDAWLTSKREKVEGEAADTKGAAATMGRWVTVSSDILVFVSNPEKIAHRPKVAGFDMDGTIITTRSGKKFAIDANDWVFFSPDVPGRLQQLHNEGYKIAIFTNQKGIQTGQVNRQSLMRKFESICAKIPAPVQLFVSPGVMAYRKPYVGMWKYLEENENGDVAVDRTTCMFVGDAAGRTASADRKSKDFSSADRLFAMNLGVKFLTPEQFFLKRKVEEPFSLPVFNPSAFLDEKRSLIEPASTALPGTGKELIVLVGYPGCGKSYFAAKLASDHGYGIVNRDTMKTWQKCVENAKIFLRKGKSVVVDNTNGDVEARKRYCDLARAERVDCRCFVFTCTYEQAWHNCVFRNLIGTDELHKEVGRMVLATYRKNFKEPVLKEGFASIAKVNFVPEFGSEEHERIYRMYLCDS